MRPPDEERRPLDKGAATTTTSKRPGEESDLIVPPATDRFGYGGPRRDPTAELAIARVDRERAR